MAYPGHGAEEECQEKRSTKAINQDREQADAPRTDRAFARVGASRFPRKILHYRGPARSNQAQRALLGGALLGGASQSNSFIIQIHQKARLSSCLLLGWESHSKSTGSRKHLHLKSREGGEASLVEHLPSVKEADPFAEEGHILRSTELYPLGGPCFKKDHVARFGAKNFVDNDHARADRALGENGHHRKERPQDRGWREAGSYDAALRSDRDRARNSPANEEEGTGATTGRKPNGMISDHAWGASDCLSAFEVSIEISLSVPGFHKALPFVAALGDIRYTPVIH
ncbi:hypothetical protein WN943_026975 [Citrus x changshan-huyou]